MNLHLLPTRTGGAAENMALDFLLLQRYPDAASPRFRHYEWRAPAFTFGLSQSIEFVRAQLPPGGHFDLCRRPTGGGVVDHREDWTYALVIPRGHPLEAERAAHSYRVVHAAMADAFRELGIAVVLKEHRDENGGGLPGVCFQKPEVHDVLNERTGEKIAGAAQKRNKHGLLMQGSIWKPAAGPAVDWSAFAEKFPAALAAALGLELRPTPWPEFADGEVEALIEQYSSPEWMEYR